ncbi:hypothetical protein EJV46_06930 [Roseococcus sp. SYP-B2431]|uniref:lipase family alpha/beta hydrolase n=1 Tax=Roseococcus sp. SYP-B2431 TaxID=2496640 RepID=UPI00103CCDE3|nr:hypothetical protein [Roseococcus sp. SYP-B2431]TCI00361.1 hypothetical protein EJV46_06930 [Roseococcus sp. SYP-B2431]
MSSTDEGGATRAEQPIILIRGFGGLGVEDEKRIAYQGFNDGTVYPQKRGENYIYEGLILRFMKSRWIYNDATNIVGYYNEPIIRERSSIPAELSGFDMDLFSGHKVVIDPGTALSLVRSTTDVRRTLWVFRYYDLDDREDFKRYGEALVRLIKFIRKLAEHKHQAIPRVNILAHSMGGLIVREAIQRSYEKGRAADHINKIVTLGTPHQGISFQLLKNWTGTGVGAAAELEQFNPDLQKRPENPVGFPKFSEHFPADRILTVVGTNYRTYGPVVASWLNRAFSVTGEFGANYNRSDGLVKQAYAQLPGAPRCFVHKCHGGPDSLVTSRESFEISTRFFFGNIKVRLNLVKAMVKRGQDWFGKSEFFFGVSIKPRRVDFELFHQSAEAENCYGPFSKPDLSDTSHDGVAFNWADGDAGKRLIWEGWLDTGAVATPRAVGPRDDAAAAQARAAPPDDVVMRLDFYLGERDLFGIGFSDNVVFRKQYYARATFDDVTDPGTLRELVLHTGEDFNDPRHSKIMRRSGTLWEFDVEGTGFDATFGLEFALA